MISVFYFDVKWTCLFLLIVVCFYDKWFAKCVNTKSCTRVWSWFALLDDFACLAQWLTSGTVENTCFNRWHGCYITVPNKTKVEYRLKHLALITMCIRNVRCMSYTGKCWVIFSPRSTMCTRCVWWDDGVSVSASLQMQHFLCRGFLPLLSLKREDVAK